MKHWCIFQKFITFKKWQNVETAVNDLKICKLKFQNGEHFRFDKGLVNRTLAKSKKWNDLFEIMRLPLGIKSPIGEAKVVIKTNKQTNFFGLIVEEHYAGMKLGAINM